MAPTADRDELVNLYYSEGKTLAEIGEVYDVVEATIINWMNAYDIPRVDADQDVEKPWQSEEILRELYWDKLRTQDEMAELLDVSNQTVSNWLDRHDIEKRSLSVSHLVKQIRETDEPWTDEYLMGTLYDDHLLSATEIANLFGTSANKVYYYQDKLDIERRSRSEANHLKHNGELPSAGGSNLVAADGGERGAADDPNVYDPDEDIADAIEGGPDDPDDGGDDDDDDDDSIYTPMLKFRALVVVTGWSDTRYKDVSKSELQRDAIVYLRDGQFSDGFDLLQNEGVIKFDRYSNGGGMYVLTGEDVPWDETLEDLIDKVPHNIPQERFSEYEDDPTALA